MEAPVTLIIEDEPALARLISFNLEREGMRCVESGTGMGGLELARKLLPRAILLDLNLPDVPGTEVLRQLKRDPSTTAIPVIIVSASDSEIDRVVGFELGAADYVVKPFSPRELALRARRLGQQPQARRRLRTGSLVIDQDAARVTVDGREVSVAPLEFRLLEVLIENLGQVKTRTELLDEVWPDDGTAYERTVDVHMWRLRRKLGSTGKRIETVYGKGYRLR